MGAIAEIKDGKVVESATASSLAKSSEKKSGSTVDKEAFLQLLVAQMKYQDPLEPTSNTEYISQYATFSELEQMQNMSATLELSRASTLVGQTVLMKVTDSSGNTTTVQGNVDYVVYENNKAFLSINGELYSLDDLDTVADEKYLEAYTLAAEFLNLYNKLPKVGELTIGDREDVEKVQKMYDEMNDYQKKFISSDYVEGLKKYTRRMNDLVKAQDDLLGIIESLQRQMEKQFLENFRLLQQYLGETFVKLFGGGKAELRLMDEKDVLGCGIDIVAQPPGKKLQLLSLLSGGERALTAIAILFAMLDIRPSPFCILDEIEAALDEANVANFADYLKQYSHDTQFIVVTHRKGTMERCDALYGVAMEEKGVSRMVSVQLSELQKQLEDESNDLEQ